MPRRLVDNAFDSDNYVIMDDANTFLAKDLSALRNAEEVNRAIYATKADLARLELSLTKLILIVALALGGLIILVSLIR